MATKKTDKGALAALPKQLRTVRHDIERAARRAWKEAVDALPAAPRKAVRNLVQEFERATAQVRKRVKKTRADVEARGERLVDTVTERAEKVLNPMVRRLDVASRSDVDRLRKRIAALEKRIEAPAHAAPMA
jgi:polyhydroxyalkanoate synthesis regulator phasin